MIDSDHNALYAAELAAFDGTDLEDIRPFYQVRALIDAVVAGAWWPSGGVNVRAARSDAQSSSTRCAVSDGGPGTIRLAASQMTIATAAHELAHVLAGPAEGHGAPYRRAYLDVVRVMTNIDSTDRRRDLHVDQLTEAFSAAGLDVGARRWPAPPAGTGSAFAL
ncbi:MAG: hypothetical protein ACI8RE_001972 [Ilumatobacter sp.]|jgi:hypothetical protein